MQCKECARWLATRRLIKNSVKCEECHGPCSKVKLANRMNPVGSNEGRLHAVELRKMDNQQPKIQPKQHVRIIHRSKWPSPNPALPRGAPPIQIVFWKVQPSISPWWLGTLLALAGDIEENPGPTNHNQTNKNITYNCNLCNKNINKNQTSLLCNHNTGPHWIHKKCSTINNTTQYNNTWKCTIHSAPRHNNAPTTNCTKKPNSKNTKLKILQININGISNKLTELTHLAQTSNIDIITIQESKLTNNIKTPNIPLYTTIRKDRTRNKGGGLLTYIKHNITFTENNLPTHLNNDTTEAQSFTIHLNTKKSITLINLYITPTQHKQQEYIEIQNIFTHITSTPNTIITSDINAHSKAWYSHKTDKRGEFIENIILSSDQHFLNKNTPTRIPPTKHQQPSSPDITTISNNLLSQTTWKTIHDLSSDHLPIITEIDTNIKYKLTQNRTSYTNYNKADWPAFTDYIETLIQHTIPDDNIHTANQTLTNIILKADKHYIPKGRIKNTKLLLPIQIREKIKERNLFRKQNKTYEQIITLNNQITKEINTYKTNIWLNKLNQNWDHKTNSHILWNTIKSLSNKNSPREPNRTITFNNNTINNSQSITNHFNKQFTTNIIHQTNSQNRQINRHTKNIKPENITITTQQVSDAIKNSTNNNSTGPDNINIKHLKHLGPLAIKFLTILYNNSLNKNIIPQIWKIAKIIPIPKPNKDTNLSSSYRPISLLSPIAKTLEKSILPYFTNNINNIEHQHGFKKQHSTTTALHHINNTIIRGFNTKKPHLRTVMVALDMSKAFDTVNIHKLINKIKTNTNIPPTIIKFTANYLKGRQGYTIFNNHKSKHALIKTGVPQGGVLSPTLFNIYMSDLPIPPINVDIKTFADDITTYTQHRDFHTAENNLQTYLTQIQNWTTLNNLQINPNKSTSTLFTLDPIEHNQQLNLKIDNINIPTNKNPKILGLTFDPKLKYNAQTQQTITKAKKSLRIIKSLSGTHWGKQKETLLTTYKTITRPLLEYGCTIWSSNTAPTNIKKLQTIQNNAIRISTGCTHDTNTNHLHSESNMLPIEPHLKLHASQLIQNSLNPSHPLFTLNKLNNLRKRKKTTRENIFDSNTPYITHREIANPIDIETQIKNNKIDIHTTIVKQYTQTSINKLLNTVTPNINKTEQTLHRETRRTLAQLRAGKSPFLLSYLNKIDPTNHPSPKCPLCTTQEHTTQHLFNCKTIPTTLKIIDLWENPVSVSELLATWTSKLAGLP